MLIMTIAGYTLLFRHVLNILTILAINFFFASSTLTQIIDECKIDYTFVLRESESEWKILFVRVSN